MEQLAGTKTARKRANEESFGIENYSKLTESNLGEFLKSKKTIFKAEKLHEIWEILSSQLGEEINKEHIKALTEEELKEMGIPIGVIKHLIAWSQESIDMNSVNGNLMNSINEEFEMIFNQMRIAWILPKKGSKSRANWKVYETGKTGRQTLTDWRNEFQIERKVDPQHIIKNCSNPFPRLISVPENAKRARILVKGRENEQDLVEGNIVPVNQQLREADFINFKITRASYNEHLRVREGWVLKFEALDDNNMVLQTEETGAIQVMNYGTETIPALLRIDELVPPFGVIYLQHKVHIFANLPYNPTMKLYFGQEAKLFEWKKDGILALGVSSNIPQQVPVYVEMDHQKSNELNFTFFNPADLAQEMGLSTSSKQFSQSHSNGDSNKINLTYDYISFLMNNGQITQFRVKEKCSYPITLFTASLKYKLEELKTSRDHGGFTFLHWSCGQGDLELTQFFIENGFDINQRDYFDATPLHWAIRSQSKEVISYLLSKGANLEVEDFYGVTPHLLADTIEKEKNEQLFREACLKGDLNTIQGLMKKGINMLSEDQNGKTGFELAFENQRQSVVDFLLSDLEYVNQSNKYPQYPNDPMDISENTKSPKNLSPPKQHLSPYERKQEVRDEELNEKLDLEAESFKNVVETSAFATKIIQIRNSKKTLYFFKPETIWELFASKEESIDWKEFRKRCHFISMENIVYLQNNVKYLNVSANILRGAKKWLTDEKHEKILKAKFVGILQHFEPIPCCPNKYKKCEPFGFTLSDIFQTLSLHCFAGPVSPSDLEKVLEPSFVGDHRFRFSSSMPLSFTLDFKSKNQNIRCLRLNRLNIEGIEKQVGYATESRHKFFSLVEFEHKLEQDPKLASELDIEWQPASYNPQEVLDEEEGKMYQFLMEKKLEHLYPKLIYGKGIYIDSLDRLQQVLSHNDELLQSLKSNFEREEDFTKLCTYFPL